MLVILLQEKKVQGVHTKKEEVEEGREGYKSSLNKIPPKIIIIIDISRTRNTCELIYTPRYIK